MVAVPRSAATRRMDSAASPSASAIRTAASTVRFCCCRTEFVVGSADVLLVGLNRLRRGYAVRRRVGGDDRPDAGRRPDQSRLVRRKSGEILSGPWRSCTMFESSADSPGPVAARRLAPGDRPVGSRKLCSSHGRAGRESGRRGPAEPTRAGGVTRGERRRLDSSDRAAQLAGSATSGRPRPSSGSWSAAWRAAGPGGDGRPADRRRSR